MIGSVDGTMPVSVSHFIERNNELIHMHGGVATRMTFDSLEEMPIDEFLKTAAARVVGNSDIAVFGRDGVHDRMYRILGDTAVIYYGVNFKDAFIDAVFKELQEDKPLVLDLNLTYPLVRYTQLSGGDRRICVYVPEHEFLFRTSLGQSFPIWHPPIWLSVTMTATNMPKSHRICAVIERGDSVADTKIYEIPFPNIHQNGEICFGSTSLTGVGDKELTPAMAIQLTYNRFFMSEFNHDLMYYSKTGLLECYYEKLPRDPEIESEIQATSHVDVKDFLRIARCFKTRADMLGFPYKEFSSSWKDQY